ncbi:MAG: NHL repeat-containing protein [Anaerosomatales bacterium]|nr:NHL repeat-containing protein [Anaerosomatales bacterium]
MRESEFETRSASAVEGDVQYVEERVVEYVTNRRQRGLLIIALVALFLLLIGLIVGVTMLSSPVGAPTEGDLPEDIEWVRSIYGWGTAPEQALASPVDAAVAPDGTIWVVSGKTTIVAFEPDGSLERLVELPFGEGEGQVSALEGLDVADDGSVYVCDYGNNKVIVLSPEGELTNEWSVQLPNEIAVQGDRVALAAAFGVGVFTTEGEPISTWGSRGAGLENFDLPHGIAFGENGEVFVSDTHNERVKAYTQDGRLLWVSRTSGVPASEASAEATGSAYQLPAGMTFDAAGRLLVVDPFEFAIFALDPETGDITDRYGDFGSADGLFAYPTGVSYDDARDWFVVADTANNRVQIIRLAGSGGNAVVAAIATAFDRPIWLFLLPILLLLAALAVAVARRKRQRLEARRIAGSGVKNRPGNAD